MRPFLLGLIFLWAWVASAKEVNLKWKPIDGAKKYNLQVAHDDGFSKVILDKTIDKASYPYELKAGMYYLRVQGIDALGRPGEWSKPFHLVVTAPVKPMAEKPGTQKVTYAERSPDVKTQWEASEKATSYRVRIVKDGHEVESKETKSPEVAFQPPEPGDYKVEVSSGFGKFFGPAVTVQQVHVEKKKLVPPVWGMSTDEKFSSRKGITFKWNEVEGAHAYRLKVFKMEQGRRPASDTEAVTIQDTSDPSVKLDPLPPGRYVAIVEAREGDLVVAPSTEYTFDVKRTKPVEFDRLDFIGRYTVHQVKYSNAVIEAGSNNSSNSIGGEAIVEGTMWFPESNFGLRAGGSWGGFNVNSSPISYNDLQFAGMYRLSTTWRNGLRMDIKPFLGGRAWTFPIVLSNTSSTTSGLEVLAPTMVGPVAGVEVNAPLSDRWALTSRLQVSAPVTHSNIASGDVQAPLDFTPNPKAELGVKVAFLGDLRLLAMAGYQSDKFQYSAPHGNNGQAVSGDPKTMGSISGGTFSVGLEASDDGAGFRIKDHSRAERFSEFDLTARYLATPASYSGKLQEEARNGGPAPSVNFNGALSGTVEFETVGWLPSSRNGGRLLAAWGGFTYGGATFAFPEFMVQWGFRTENKLKKPNSRMNNYLGIRAWQVPLVSIDQSNNNSVFTHNPQLVGPADTFQYFHRLGASWDLRLTAELSTPFFAMNKDVVDKILPSYMSYKAEASAIKTLNEDLSGGVGLGYRADQLRYIPTGGTEQASSTVTMTSPTLSLFGTYSF